MNCEHLWASGSDVNACVLRKDVHVHTAIESFVYTRTVYIHVRHIVLLILGFLFGENSNKKTVSTHYVYSSKHQNVHRAMTRQGACA